MQRQTLIRNIGYLVLGVLLIIAVWLAFATYEPDLNGKGQLFLFAVEHHIALMTGMVIISGLFGFFLAQFFYTQLQRSRTTSSSIMETVFLFLGHEEREIVRYLVERGGETTQAEISRLPHMSRVRAHRFLQKMQEKQIIEVIPHGKVRRVRLREHILTTLREK